MVLTGMLSGDWWARAIFSELKKEKGEEMEAGILKTTLCNFIIQGGKEIGQQLRGVLGSWNKYKVLV